MWAIWTARNKLLHEGQHSTASETMNLFKRYLGEVDGAKEKLVVCKVPLVCWKMPKEHFVKINFDARFCKQNNKSCSRIIIRDDSGLVLWSKTIMHVNIHSPFAAEAMACFQAAEMGLQLGFLRVEIEGDSLAVIRKLNEERVE
ncbi:hypothetical protein Godav_020919, partial [Gossypium davidsonii]|nr:hypothetical protein [Gossypium davidsonii]